MDKPTATKGFTLVELLIVLCIISCEILITIPASKKIIGLKEVSLQQINDQIELARTSAILKKESVTITFCNKQIINDGLFVEIPNMKVDKSFSVTYNSEGHIQKGGHVMITLNNKTYKLIFNIGQGAYRYEEQ